MAAPGGLCEGLVESLGQLGLAEKRAVKLDSGKLTYILEMAVQQGEDPSVAAATSKYEIHLLSRNHLTSKALLSGHTQQITGLSFGKNEQHCLFSSSADRTVRCWDSRTACQKEEQKFEGPSNVKLEILCIDSNQSDRLLCAGTESTSKDDPYILFWDRRMGSLLGSYTDSHDNNINQVRFKPESENILASGSSDGLVCTFDLNNTNEDDALQMTFNADSDVERIGWCGKSNDDVYCVTTDSVFCVWDSIEGDERCNVSGPAALASNSKEPIEYVMDCIPEYTALGENCQEALVVAGCYDGSISLLGVSSNGDSSKLIKKLSGGHNTTVRCSHWDSKTKSLLTAGEDAFLCLWSMDGVFSSSKKTSQVMKKERKGQEAKKPYSKQKKNRNS